MLTGLIRSRSRDRGRTRPRRLLRLRDGRGSRHGGPSEIDRPETIEDTGDLIAAAGGTGAARVVDHEDPAAVGDLVATIERDPPGHAAPILLTNRLARRCQWRSSPPPPPTLRPTAVA
ncbi:hypothetical protein [Microbacterium elymi]|uniref:Uncharacterized protein n=1 Tax=Microbacterium elymi TaxID=2909587 RepID=A0ABY5NH87_9MICO|nr:hypothetical protein [Microbacterium elymi]UUT34532.1 hypothetical protein L2X98_28775 [Microbacterium elymi]